MPTLLRLPTIAMLSMVALIAESAYCRERISAEAPQEKVDVYLVPFSHLDLYWAGTEEECLSRGNRIITKVVRLATRYPQFRFLLEDDIFVAHYLQTHRGSAELEQLKRLIKEGRIEVAPKWAAIHQNLPRGEALVRNVLYGKRYAREVLGVNPRVAHLGDIPGYTPQFAQILAKADTPFMVMTRVGPADKSLFYWKALDGSKTLVWNTLKGYGWGTFLTSNRLTDEQKQERFAKDLAQVRKTTDGPIFMNWGTDLFAPPDDLVERIEAFNRSAPARLVFSTPSEFFRRVEQSREIPELSGEIPYAWGNILTSIVHLWPPAVAAADTLVTAEKFAAISYALGYGAYPQQEFESLWKKVLEAMDHNNYGQGGRIGDGRKLEYASVASLRGGEILRSAIENIAERVRSPFARSMPIVVFNPLSWKRDDLVTAHVSLYGDVAPGDIDDYRKGVRVVDEKGESVPFYIEQSSGTVSRALEMVFFARGVPSLGYKTFFVVPTEKPDTFPNASEVKLDVNELQPKWVAGTDQLENEYYRVTLDRATGRSTVFDKELGRPVVKDMEMVASEERGGNSLSQEVMSGRTLVHTVSQVEIEENNPVRTVARIDGNIGGVPVVQRVFLYRGVKRVDLENRVEWKTGKLMRMEQIFPYEHPDAQIQYGVPFGALSTADLVPNSGPHGGDEISQDVWKQWRQIQDWIFAGTRDWGLTVAADHQVVTLAPGVIRAGMLRGAYSTVGITRNGKLSLLPVPPGDTYVFHYSVSSGKGDWTAAKSYRAGMALNNPLVPVSPADELSQKSLPPTQSFWSFEADHLLVSALKKAELDGAIVLRVAEIEGAPAETPLLFLGQRRNFRMANLLEEELRPAEQPILRVAPHEISTVRVQIK